MPLVTRLAPLLVLALALLMTIAPTAEARRPRDVVRGEEPGHFDYYLMTLSWSPAYCVVHPDDESQCGTRGLGFVLHGLWPQFFNGGWPEDCPGPGEIPSTVRRRTLAFMPSERLIEHEWRKHGTCSGLGPEGYFNAADQAFGRVQIPKALSGLDAPQTWSAEDVARAFREVNPAIPAGGIAVSCSGSALSEVRVCLDHDLNPIDCGRGVTTHCRRGPLRIILQR